MAPEDTELMLEVKAGGVGAEAAFAELLERNHDAVIAFFYRKAWNQADAEDLAQEVFMKVWGARHSYEPRASFRAYLFQIARNHWVDAVRSRRVRPTFLTGSAGDEPSAIELEPASGSSPAESVELGELRAHLCRAVLQLSTGQREVWELAEAQGLLYTEIGRILGIPVGTVKSRHHHAVRRLREELTRAGVLPPSSGRDADSAPAKTQTEENGSASARPRPRRPTPGDT